MLKKIRNRWNNASARSRLAAKNIVASVLLKGVSILSSLLIVPLTIDYIDGTKYGIWLTISSIVAWANFFDLGLANGFKNKFAQAKAAENTLLARQYVSTTYLLITIIMVILLCLLTVINQFIDWSTIINVNKSFREELTHIFMILAFFFCMNMIANIFSKLLEADQHPAISSCIHCIAQIFSLVVIFILTKTTTGSLMNLAIYYSGIPFITMALCSIIMFRFTKYRQYSPSIKFFKKSLIKDLFGLGVRFFIIYICLIFIFQMMNIVLSRECGSEAVTEYNIAYKYFSVIYMAIIIVVSPMWAAFTDAYTKKEYDWMFNTLKKLEYCILFSIFILVLMLTISQFLYKIWIGDSVRITMLLSLSVMIYVATQVMGAVYMHLINGIGVIRLQFYIYLFFSLLSFPLMTLSCRLFGVDGIVIVPSLVYVIQAIVGRVQLRKILNGTAAGIWLKS